MAPIRSTIGRSVGKLLNTFRDRDLSLDSSVRTARKPPLSASGGTVTAAGITPGNGYKYHVFTSPGTFTVDSGEGEIEYLVVAGGGTAGGNGAGGGGGGLRTNVSGNPKAGAALPISAGSYTITVGSPGVAAASLPGPGTPGPTGNGGYSAFDDGGASQIRSEGGGCGGSPGGVGRPGGSGGGGSGFPSSVATAGGFGNQPPTSPSQGNDGGVGCTNCPYPGPGGYAAGGGGGAGNTGGNAGPGDAGDGAPGHPIPAFSAPLIQPEIPAPNWSAFSSAVGPTGLYAGGGGGGGYGGVSTPGTGGPGGGGAGGVQNGSSFAPGQNGTTYTGGGGGGAVSHLPQDGGGTPGVGGSGIVIIRYLT